MRLWMAKARKEQGYTMSETAEKLGISESYYSMIERGERQQNLDITLASKLADVLKIPLEKIVLFERS